MDFDLPAWKDSARSFLAGWWDDFVAAGRFLTRLPLTRLSLAHTGLLARSMRAFPLVGVVVGLAGWAAFAVADGIGLPSMVAALLALVATVLVTGALHEDGLADTADGLGGGEGRAGKLAIMRDSRSGAYGVLALVFSVTLRAAALTVLTTPHVGAALVAAHAVSRAGLPVVMRWLEPARDDGLGASSGQPGDSAVAWCLGIALVVALPCLGLEPGLVAVIVAAAAMASLAGLAQRQIGGYTGDVLGAAQQIGEIAMLLTAAAFA
jgi:adenosylcobinamide-GDP ribazoletransferase